jgi:hypothetical protein
MLVENVSAKAVASRSRFTACQDVIVQSPNEENYSTLRT